MSHLGPIWNNLDAKFDNPGQIWPMTQFTIVVLVGHGWLDILTKISRGSLSLSCILVSSSSCSYSLSATFSPSYLLSLLQTRPRKQKSLRLVLYTLCWYDYDIMCFNIKMCYLKKNGTEQNAGTRYGKFQTFLLFFGLFLETFLIGDKKIIIWRSH